MQAFFFIFIKIILAFPFITNYNNIRFTKFLYEASHCALLAQLVEHLTLNQGVQGSSPWRRTADTAFGDRFRQVSFFVRFFTFHIPYLTDRRPAMRRGA